MQIESVALSLLSEDPSNARKHDKKNLDAIAGSLKKFGQQKPIVVDKNGIILAGNGTFQAAKKLKLKLLEVVRTELEGDEAKAYALADNRTQELSTWDDEILSKALTELCEVNFDVGEIGFDETFVKGHVREDAKGNIEDDEVPDVPKNIHNVTRGQVWKLGEHRLMCGDSTVEADVAKLMYGQKADMVFTDPPYGMSLDTDFTHLKGSIPSNKGVGKKYDKVLNDDVEFNPTFLFKLFAGVKEQFWFGADYYCRSLEYNKGSWIVWDKTLTESADKSIGSNFELCWSAQKHKREIARIKWSGFYGMEKDDLKTRVHPTQKPVILAEWFFDHWGNETKTVVDLFGGSGSTLIACEKTSRKCFMMELDEHYCSVIIERWQKYTGNKAQLLTT